MLTLGIDDAGRGPLIGPMILSGVLVDSTQANKLKKLKVRDSKIVSQEERVELAGLIEKNSLKIKIVISFPAEIDSAVEGSSNLNTLEAKKAGEIINSINKGKFRKNKIKVIVDCPSNNLMAWKGTLLRFIEFKDNLEVICEHKADANHISVAAGSIMAKVTREQEVAKIKKVHGGIGSGYASDPITQTFLKKNGRRLSDSGIFRKSWATWKKLFPTTGQKTLDGF